MKIDVYYVVRVYKDGRAVIDSGPHCSWLEAHQNREDDHRWNADDYEIFETSIEGNIV